MSVMLASNEQPVKRYFTLLERFISVRLRAYETDRCNAECGTAGIRHLRRVSAKSQAHEGATDRDCHPCEPDSLGQGESQTAMTVKELLMALAELPDEAVVVAEGCDCANLVRAVIVHQNIPADEDDDEDTPLQEAWKFKCFPADAVVLRVDLS